MADAIEHELTFCAEVAGWLNHELETRPELAFGHVKTEQSSRGSRTRRDLSMTDRSGKVAVTGEVKLPYMADGGSPFNPAVVEDAHGKAARVGATFFFTWNVNRIVLWRTDEAGKALYDRHIYDATLAQVRRESDLANPAVSQAIRRGLVKFLERASQAFTGVLPLAQRPLDEFFITVLEAALERPIANTLAAIIGKYDQDALFKTQLDSWMRDTQQWHLSDDPLMQQDNLERAAKFSCYVLVNKIVFYCALRKRYTRLPAVRIPAALTDVRRLQSLFVDYFDRAKKATRDYETVFDGDFADSLPFTSEHVVSGWRDLLGSIEEFDFTRLDYDVIGPIFERLISPEERHRYGQHYTKAEIVDLIEAFCIRKPDAAVLDPSCGGGTFLVRAYNRKKFLAQRAGLTLAHETLLSQLCGVDISAYAAHLTTMNLATRDLIDERNYPLVAQSDFFDVQRGQALFHVPMATGAKDKQLRPVVIPDVDAIVGNPPYVRQEEISKPPTASAKGRGKVGPRSLDQIKADADTYKKRLAGLARQAWPAMRPSGRSDLHVYFWPHAFTLLKPDGYYGFLTSSGWLDVEYGFALQEFILNHYAIVAIFESQVEPWFTGARITTCATILRREPDAQRRADNLIRFVQLRWPLSSIFPPNATEEQRQLAAEALRDRIESTTENTVDEHWRVRVINQGELYRLGCRPADGDIEAEDDEVSPPAAGNGRNGQHVHEAANGYTGSKWGLYLRAPDLFFELQDRYRDRFAPVSEVAEVRFGVKSGCDKFFFVRDVTERCQSETADPREFRKKYGIQRDQADQIRIVLAGDGSLHLIEAKYLEPEVHNLMENNGVHGIRIDPKELRLKVFLCDKPKTALKKTYALRYIEWGEREGFNKGPTCASRAASRPWYDLSPGPPGDMFWPMAQQYRHLAPLNDRRLVCNHNLFDVFAREETDPRVLCGVLNSTLVAMHKHIFGRLAGTEGNLKTEVVDVKMMLVPDPRQASASAKARIQTALDLMARRHTRNLQDEFELADRQVLDDAVLELLGETDPAERAKIRARLYEDMTAMHKAIRDKELLANENKKQTKRGSKLSPQQLAQEIWAELHPSLVKRFPEDFFDVAQAVDNVELADGKLRVIDNSLMSQVGVDMNGQYTELGDQRRAQLAKAVFDAGRRGLVPIPRDGGVCDLARGQFRVYEDQAMDELHILIAAKTANEKMQAKVLHLLKHRLIQPDAD